eukprot:5600120-Pleurochrysis_carterae.AAC.1
MSAQAKRLAMQQSRRPGDRGWAVGRGRRSWVLHACERSRGTQARPMMACLPRKWSRGGEVRCSSA